MKVWRRRALPFLLAALAAALLRPAGPVPVGKDAPVRFAVVGDGGSGDRHQHLVAQRMAEWHDRLLFGFVLMLGDNIYGGWLGRGGGHRKYFARQFDEPYAALLARGVVFRASIGNHDARTRDGRDLIEDRKRFGMDGAEGYYRFAAGRQPAQAGTVRASGEDGAPLVEFFALNTDRLVERREDPDQLAWLEKALAASRARWRIVYGHNPLYSTGKRHGGDDALRAILEPILVGAEGKGDSTPRAHAFLAGHDHIYERLKAQKGIVHFVCGSSGKLRRGDARRTPDVAVAEDQLRAFMLWEATPDALTFRAINEEGNAFDCGRILSGGAVETVACSALPGNP